MADEKMVEYLRLKKLMDEYHELRLLLELVRRPQLEAPPRALVKYLEKAIHSGSRPRKVAGA